MQAQLTRNATQAITYSQSLTAVKTLLQAGLGAITYLRNLLPEDNFSSSHFTTSEDSLSTGNSDNSFSQEASQTSDNSRKNINRFRIMSMARGYTDEADRILNYMEYGIFDALEKNYLKSFIFAIYLDEREPNNIVEAYTFNFKYHTLPGSDISVPVMSLGGGVESLSTSRKSRNTEDPVAKAIRSGKAPTVKDVKTSIKALLKTLMHAMHHMEILPRRRFATFKVFYTAETPADYEPPYFKAGDVDKDRWYFMTHDLDEVPDKIKFGELRTGHHSVNLSVTSIASFLPSSKELDDLAFTGTTTYPHARITLSPIQEAAFCKQQAEKQREDAETRNIVWSGENNLDLDDLDAECEDDLEYIQLPDGRYERIDATCPIGMRNKDGDIEPLAARGLEELSEAQFSGFSENVPIRLQEIADGQTPANHNLEETQTLLLTPKNLAPSTLPPSSEDYSMSPPISSALTPISSFDPEMLKTMSIRGSEIFDTEMPDMETQILSTGAQVLESSGQEIAAERPNARHGHDDNGLDCFCEVFIEDDILFCDGGCKKWFHVWCMGYHSTEDSRIPATFICFDCRIHADVNWELIKHEIYPRMRSKFKELALFRRAIKVAEEANIFTAAQYSKAFDKKEAILSRLFLKRLEEEGYILQESMAVDDEDSGLATTRAKPRGRGRGKNKTTKPRRLNQKIRYVFNHSIKTSLQYLNYFKPDDQEVGDRLLATAVAETQTQEATQALEVLNLEELGDKRAGPGMELTRPLKRIKKISVVIPVDLAE